MTETFGARLRRERERRQVSLASITEATKISVSLLEALERDDVSHWPPGIFRRSFIRGYAEALGLDPEAVLREFTHCFPEPGALGPPPPSMAPRLLVLPATPLRLTLAEEGMGPLLRVRTRLSRRWPSVAWDVGLLLVAALTGRALVGSFWMALAVLALVYYAGGALVLGTTLGAILFERRATGRPRGLRLVESARRTEDAVEHAGGDGQRTSHPGRPTHRAAG